MHDALFCEGFVFFRMSLNGIGDLADIVVPKDIAVRTRLIKNSVRNHVTALKFFDEAFAFLINKDGSVKSCVGNQLDHAGNRVTNRIGLDVLHVDQFSAGFLSHVKCFTGSSRSVRRLEAFVEARVVFLNHGCIGTESACCQDNAALSVEIILLAVRFAAHTDYAAVFVLNQSNSFHAGDDRNLFFLSQSRKFCNVFGSGLTDRNQSAFNGVSAELEEVMRFISDTDSVLQPFSCGQCTVRHGFDNSGVALVIAALEGILSVQFRRIFNAEFFLNPALCHIHFCAGNQRVTADLRHFFQENNGYAQGFSC